MATVQVQGVAELVGRMKALPDKLKNKGMRSAMKAAARPIVQATKGLAPLETGLLRQSIASVVVKSKDSYSALIGMRHITSSKRKGFKPSKRVIRAVADVGRAGDPARYAHLVEFGHNVVRRGQAISSKERRKAGKQGVSAAALGSARGLSRVPAKPFLRPGLQSAQGQAEQILAQELNSFLEQEAGK